MPPIVIPFTYEVRCNWNAPGGVKPVNVFHVSAVGGGNEADIGHDVHLAMETGMFWPMSTGATLESVMVTKLDGVTAGVVTGVGDIVGSGIGELIPAGCAVVSLRSETRGSQGRGRVYVGPVTEDQQASGLLGATARTNMQATWADFAFVKLPAAAHPMTLVVASRKHLVAHEVKSLIVDLPLGTQRRRQSQLRA